MLRPACCAIALSFLLAGCGEATDPVHRSGTLVKTCPNLRTFDVLPFLSSFIRRVCSGYAPDRGVLRTQLV